MGKRSIGKIESRAVGAFSRQRTWRAVDLAHVCAVDVEELGACLHRLRGWGLPLAQRVVDGDVEYSVSHYWSELWNGVGAAQSSAAQSSAAQSSAAQSSAAGVTERGAATAVAGSVAAFAPEVPPLRSDRLQDDSESPVNRAIAELEFLVEAMLRMPKGKLRDRLLRRVLEGRFMATEADVSELCVGLSESANHSLQQLLLTAASHRLTVRARVFDSRGSLTIARLTVHRVVPSPNGIVATDHAGRKLKWYPYECIVSASLVREEKGRRADPEELEAFMDNLLSHDSERVALEHAFTVRYPEADWVAAHLPPGMSVDETSAESGRLRVVVRDNGPLAARLVASLGGAATAEGPILTGLVTGIAAGTLAAHRRVAEPKLSHQAEHVGEGNSPSRRQEGDLRRSTFRPRPHATGLDRDEPHQEGDHMPRSTFRPRPHGNGRQEELPCVAKAPSDEALARNFVAASKPRS